MNTPNKIDFSVKKSEAEWRHVIDNFFLKATPKVYEWLSWVITLAALTYVQYKTNSTYISVVVVITYTLTYFYYIAHFYQFLFIGLPFFKKTRLALFVSYVLSSLLAVITWLVVRETVNAVTMSQL